MKAVTFGEIMMRLNPEGYLRFVQANSFEVSYAGGEANVAVSLANYGVDAAFVSKVPAHEIGQCVVNELRRYGVDTKYLLRGGPRLGVYYCEKGASQRASKVIYDRAGSSIATAKAEEFDWDGIFEGADWFHWTGITPAISQGAASVCLEAVKAASKMGVRISCDLNYRKNLWKWGKSAGEVMPELVSYSDVIIGNEEDAEKVFGIKGEGCEAEGLTLMRMFPKAKKIAITQRESLNADHNLWSAVLYDGSRLFVSRKYDITDIVDRVGGGDSFAAGLIYGILNCGDDAAALEFAVAASCLKHTIEGDFNRVTVREVESLMNGNATGRISR